LHLQSGNLQLLIDPEGEANYRIWKPREESADKDFLLELKNVGMTDMQVEFDNRALDIHAHGLLRKTTFKGMFSRIEYSVSAGIDGILHHYNNEGVEFFREQKISIGVDVSVDPRAISITNGSLELSGQRMLLSGEILRPKPLEFNLNLEGRHLELETLLKQVAVLSNKYPEDLVAGGKLDIRGTIKGTASNTKMPALDAGFSLRDGWLRKGSLEIRELRTDGRYSNGIHKGPRSSNIQLDGVSMKLGNSRIGGDYEVYNLVRPEFSYRIICDLDLQDLRSFHGVDSLFSHLEGRLQAEVHMKGDQALLVKLRKQDLLDYEYRASMQLLDASLTLRQPELEFSGFNGVADFTDHLKIENLNGIFEGSQVSLSGRIDNFLEFLLTPDGNLWMDADIYSERMDLNHLRNISANRGKDSTVDGVVLPGRLYLKTRFWFDELEIKDFNARQVTGNFIYKPRRLSINQLELLSMDGRLSSEGMLEQQRDMNFLVKTASKIYSVDISKAFTSFNNFGQEFISDNHLKGSLNGTVNFSSALNTNMKIIKKSILADCDIEIRDGEIGNWDPMLKLSKFIEVEELQNISFSTLENEIFIRNEELMIPQMDIHSSAFDITASGLHGFDKNFTYKVKVALSELLAGKRQRSSPRGESEFGVIEEDGLGKVFVYLVIEGDPQGTEIRYDRRGALKNVRDQMGEERQEIRKILNEEFGLFKKDSMLPGESGEENQPDFIIEWEEKDSLSIPDKETDNKSDKERFIIVWEEDDEEEEIMPEEKRKKRRKKKNN
jgi:hypothetical protein